MGRPAHSQTKKHKTKQKNNNTNARTHEEAIHKTDSITGNVACELSDRFGGWAGHTHSTGGRKKAAVAAACGWNFHGCWFVYATLFHYHTRLTKTGYQVHTIKSLLFLICARRSFYSRWIISKIWISFILVAKKILFSMWFALDLSVLVEMLWDSTRQSTLSKVYEVIQD